MHGPITKSRKAFTLIEILVAMAVLILLVSLLANMVGQTAKSIRSAENRIDAGDAARSVLDRMGRDLQMLVTGGGATVVVGSNSAGSVSNEFFAFLSRIRGPNVANATGDTRLTSLIYVIKEHRDSALDVANAPMLDREYRAVPWDGPTSSLPQDALAIIASTASAASSPEAIFNKQVLRMAIVVQIQDGSFVTIDQAPRSATFTSSPSLPASSYPLDLSKAKALVVAVAILDGDTRIKSSDSFRQIATALPAPENGKTPLDRWQAAVDGGALDSLSLPVRQNIRLYQRIFPLR